MGTGAQNHLLLSWHVPNPEPPCLSDSVLQGVGSKALFGGPRGTEIWER